MADPLAGDAATADRVRAAAESLRAGDIRWDAVPDDWRTEAVDECWNRPLPARKDFGYDFGVTLARSLEAHSEPRIRREDLFTLAAGLGEPPAETDLVEFVVNVNAWGYGTTGYGRSRTRIVVGSPGNDTRKRFVNSAQHAIALLRRYGPVSAYYWLHNRTQGHVLWWGPAFFTKFLYFADLRNQPGEPGGALILDQRLDSQVRQLLIDPDGRRWPTSRRGAWRTPDYAMYLQLLRLIGEREGVGQRPDRVEAVLFRRSRQG